MPLLFHPVFLYVQSSILSFSLYTSFIILIVQERSVFLSLQDPGRLSTPFVSAHCARSQASPTSLSTRSAAPPQS